MEAFQVSPDIVALAEIGDKSHLHSFVLAAKFGKPLPTALFKYHVFLTRLIAFLLADRGDKTQVATVALAARCSACILIVVGAAGMMLAHIPAVCLGRRVAGSIPMRLMHVIAAVLFPILGIGALLGAGSVVGL